MNPSRRNTLLIRQAWGRDGGNHNRTTLLPEKVAFVPFIFENPSPRSAQFSQINSIWIDGAEDYLSEKDLEWHIVT